MSMPRSRRRLLAWALVLACSAPGAGAQTAAPCPGPEDMEAVHLYGLWQIRLWPEGGSEVSPHSRGVLLLEKHPDYAGSVRGELRRTVDGRDLSARVSGDVHEGEFQLDESADGVTMSAVWTGVPEDCGRSIRGSRRPAEGQPLGEPVLQFRLLRQTGWQ